MVPWGGQSCVVIGCRKKPYTFEKGIHHYSFPSDPVLRDVWIKFSRRGSDFKVKKSTAVCEKHFDKSCFKKRKKQLRLINGSVPTIFYRDTPFGMEKIRVQYDSSIMHYSEADMELLKPAYDKDDHENELLDKQRQRLLKIRKLCRFCLDEQNESKLVEINKLKHYSISIEEVYKLMSLDTMKEKIWSEFACEECFQQIIAFDGFRKRCSKAQKDVVNETKELNKKILQIQHGIDDEVLVNMEVECYIEPELEREFSSGANIENQAIVIESDLKPEICVKQELKAEITDNECNDFVNNSDTDDSNFGLDQSSFHPTEAPTSVSAIESIADVKSHSAMEPKLSTTISIVNEVSKIRIYECFFCCLKFGGKKVFKSHKCDLKQKACLFDGCGKIFTRMSGYNIHITNIHKMPKISRIFCSLCNFSMVTNSEGYKEHRRGCENRSIKKNVNNAVECKDCGKVCPNFQSYKIHSMFHQSSVTANGAKKKTSAGKPGKYICDTCGREFTDVRYLRDHTKRMHTEGLPKDKMFICDFCGKEKKNRNILWKHLHAVHANNPSPCKFCGKVFRNKALLQAHMIYHRESKRIHFCPMCPNKPPYVTAVALRRHQETHHGYGAGYHCEVCYAVYKSRAGLTTHLMSSHGIRKSSTGVIP